MALKVIFSLSIDQLGWDGSYYYDIARNIRDGYGFRTNLSLYHQGMPYFPHPTPVYPLWPRILGYWGGYFNLYQLSIWFPTILYFATLFMVYQLVKKIVPEIVYQNDHLVVRLQHVAVLMVGLHFPYFESTSRPYTEGISFFLFFLFLYRFQNISKKYGFISLLEAGAWCALLFMCRSQFFILLLSIITFYLILFFLQKRIKPLFLIMSFCIGFLSTYLPQTLYLIQETGRVDIASILLFDQYQATEALSKVVVRKEYANFFECMAYKFYGFLIAFFPWGKYSYSGVFYGLQYSIVLACICILSKYKHKGALSSMASQLRRYCLDPKNHFKAVFILFSIFSFISIQMLHKNIWSTWNFASRHGFVVSFLIFVSFAYIFKFARSKEIKKAARLIILLGAVIGFSNVVFQTQTKLFFTKTLYEKRRHLIDWVNGEASNTKKNEMIKNLTLAMYNPQWLVPYTDNVGFHWIYDKTSEQELKKIFGSFKTDYLLLDEQEYEIYREKIKGFDRMFIPYKQGISGFSIFRYNTEPF